MIEGTSGEMTLADEREDTVARFIEWVYTGQYPDPEPPSEDPTVAGETEEARFIAAINSLSTSDRQEALLQSNSSDLEEDGDPVLMAHAMLYVFADRFNVQKLKQQTFAKLTARIVTIDVPRKRKSRLAIIYLVSYAFGNLPQCRPSEPLLEYLGVYASWILESLREEPEFFDLLESDIDFLKELLRHVRRGNKAPWGVEVECQEQACYRCQDCPKSSTFIPTWSVPKKVCNFCNRTCQLMIS